jgi:DNA replication and repair protein RecF
VHIIDLSLTTYRNITQADLQCHPRFNLVVGDNGQGKTNFLSSIYWLSTLTPMRTQKVRELVQWGTQQVQVHSHVALQGLKHQLGVHYQSSKRQAWREGKKVNSKSYFGVLSIVSFTPHDLMIVRGPPDNRRRFLDRAVFNESTSHLDTVLRYQKALERRNAALRNESSDAILSAYESTLADVGAWLMLSRARYLLHFAPTFQDTLSAICGFDGSVNYKPSLSQAPLGEGKSALQAYLAHYWQEHRRSDRQRGFTQRGPHSDDLSLQLQSHSAKSYASQGQQRAIVLALKIAQIENLSHRLKTRPILLLDDISSELDQTRVHLLFSFLNRFEGQVFITSTHEQYIPIRNDAQIWRVKAGTITGETL